jgi:hypothetical protein
MAISLHRPGLVVLVVLAMSLAGCSPAVATAPASAPATVALAPTSPAPTPVANPVSSSPSPSPAAAVAASRPSDASLRITAPTAGQGLPAGSIQVVVSYSGPPLVPAANATKLDDYHLHYFLDESVAPYLGTSVPVPMGNPHIVHTAATQVSFDNVAAGSHTVTVMLTGSTHVSVTPPLSDVVAFTVSQ